MPKSKGVLLYSASKRGGVNFPKDDQSEVNLPISEDAFDRFSRQHYSKEKSQRTHLDYLVDLYEKVGTFYGWSYDQFMDTPYEVIKMLNSKIDEKLEKLGSGDMGFVNYQQLFTALGIGMAFGGGKD